MPKRHPSGLKKKELSELEKLLNEKKEMLLNEIESLEYSLSKEAEIGKSGMDDVDRSSFEEQMQRQESVLREKCFLLKEVEEAFERLKDETYGLCMELEEPIALQRLKVRPWVKYSVEAQKSLEKRKSLARAYGGAAAY